MTALSQRMARLEDGDQVASQCLGTDTGRGPPSLGWRLNRTGSLPQRPLGLEASIGAFTPRALEGGLLPFPEGWLPAQRRSRGTKATRAQGEPLPRGPPRWAGGEPPRPPHTAAPEGAQIHPFTRHVETGCR